MKELIFTAISAIPSIAALAWTEGHPRLWASSAIGHGPVPAMPVKPFVLYHIGAEQVFAGMQEATRPARVAVQFYAYQERGSYDTINSILKDVRETVLTLPGQESPSGNYRCTAVEWGGLSQELDDEQFKANMKYATAYFVGTQW